MRLMIGDESFPLSYRICEFDWIINAFFWNEWNCHFTLTQKSVCLCWNSVGCTFCIYSTLLMCYYRSLSFVQQQHMYNNITYAERWQYHLSLIILYERTQRKIGKKLFIVFLHRKDIITIFVSILMTFVLIYKNT